MSLTRRRAASCMIAVSPLSDTSQTGNIDAVGGFDTWRWVSGGSLHHHLEPLRMHLGLRSSDHLTGIHRKSVRSAIPGHRQYQGARSTLVHNSEGSADFRKAASTSLPAR